MSGPGQIHAYLLTTNSFHGSPSLQDRRGVFEHNSIPQPDGLNTHEVGLQPGGLNNRDSSVITQVTSDNNSFNFATNVSGNPVASLPASKPSVTSGPLGNGEYKRFNEVEKKEREAVAEDWISALLKKRL